MADDVRVTGPVSIQSESKARVAFELMQWISNQEDGQDTANRDYWLKLYNQCYKAANGSSLKYILNRDE
jgi:hypothetical protein